MRIASVLYAILPLSTAATSDLPFSLSKLTTPAVIIDKAVVTKNSQRMLERARTLGVDVR